MIPKRYINAAVVLFALAVPFWFLRYNLNPKRQEQRGLSGPDRVVLKIIAPIQWGAAMAAHQLSTWISDYFYLVDVKKNNADLAADNARLRARVRKLEALESENRRLRGLLGLKNHLTADVVSAQVIAKDTTEFFRVTQVTLDRPSRDVASNAKLPVVTLDGVVGTTGKVAGDTVEVQLVVDAGSGVDVVDERTGARGFARGTGDETKYLCKIEYVSRTDSVEVGDLLVTSGHGRRFPPGLPVARVVAVEKKPFGLYQSVIAAPTVDMSRLQEVLIILSSPEAPGEPTAPAPKEKDVPANGKSQVVGEAP
jgi:rod shape-determining protein MreC